MCYKCVFLKVGSNCGIFKQALENSSNKLQSTCGSKEFVKNSKKLNSPSLLKGQRCGNEIFESLQRFL